MFRAFLCFVVFVKLVVSEFETIHKRHEYNFTFKGPIMVLPNSNDIPFFDIGGHVIPGKERIRLTTSLPDQQGWIWSKGTASFEGFQIDLVFKISGIGRIGADGLALWVVKDKSSGGSALGAINVWNGLGIFFDTYDNDGHGNNPSVLAIINNGTKHYLSNSDGREMVIGECIRDFRNRPHPVHARISYFKETLEVTMSTGIVATDADLETCFKVNVNLPRDHYYFGLSAATGTVADDHDIEKFEVHSLSDAKNLKAEDENERVKQKQEYDEDFQRRLDNLTKAEQAVNHSRDSMKAEDLEVQKNLIAIWQELIRQNKVLKEISSKIGEMHQSDSSKLSIKGEGDLVLQIDSMRKEFLGIKSSVDTLTRKMENPNNVHQQSLNQLQSTVDGIKIQMIKDFDKITSLQTNLHQTQNKIEDLIRNVPKDQTCGSCISPAILMLVSSIQVACIIGFFIYQRNKENSAKKFY